MLVIGPIKFGLILGLVIGSQIKLNVNDSKFTLASFLIILIAGIIMAWQLGQFPFYDDVPIATGFLAALIGLFTGKLLFARSK